MQYSYVYYIPFQNLIQEYFCSIFNYLRKFDGSVLYPHS
nr:MAG TPA: hypothetical protein [Caudoviricetes sp.]